MKRYFLAVPFILAIGCGVAYNIIGQEIAPDGTLVEPFFLIPMTYLFLLIGIIGLAVNKALSFFRKPKIADK